LWRRLRRIIAWLPGLTEEEDLHLFLESHSPVVNGQLAMNAFTSHA
jgi:hypothetical protein